MMQMKKMIECAIKKYIPGCSVQSIKDKGTWIKKIFEITLDTGEVVFLKLKVHPDWGDLKHEIAVEKIFNDNGLPAPNTLAFDMSCEIIPYPFVIQERMDGIRLDSLLLQSSKKDRLAIYESIGCLYRQMHKITNDHSGLWSENPKQILYPISPNDYMYQAEIKNGSGKLALEQGRITRQTYDRIVDVWAKNMEYLKDHQPVLVHGSPFIWTIYLSVLEDNWKVTKLMSLGDVMWWDAAYDIAFFFIHHLVRLKKMNGKLMKKVMVNYQKEREYCYMQ